MASLDLVVLTPVRKSLERTSLAGLRTCVERRAPSAPPKRVARRVVGDSINDERSLHCP